MTRTEIETLLDSHQLQSLCFSPTGPAKWHDLRRNGRTKTWKRDHNRFSIPVKRGLRDAFRIEDNSPVLDYLRARP